MTLMDAVLAVVRDAQNFPGMSFEDSGSIDDLRKMVLKVHKYDGDCQHGEAENLFDGTVRCLKCQKVMAFDEFYPAKSKPENEFIDLLLKRHNSRATG